MSICAPERRIRRVAAGIVAAAPIVAIETFAVFPGGFNMIPVWDKNWILQRFAQPPWQRADSGCFGQPLGSPGEKARELAVLLREAVLHSSVLFIALLVLQLALSLSALRRHLRRESQFALLTTWVALAAIGGLLWSTAESLARMITLRG